MDWTNAWDVLIESTLAMSAGLLLALLVRRPLRYRFGAAVGYAVWLAVPLATVAVWLPAMPAPADAARLSVGVGRTASLIAEAAPALDYVATAMAVWGGGIVVVAWTLAWRQRNFVRGLGRLTRRDDGLLQAEAASGLPAAIGVWRPRIVVPRDFDRRYSREQQALMRAHERAHIERGDLYVNAFVGVLRAVFWFNPLLHYAVRHFRHDQELACDQRVIAAHPNARRAYGQAMLDAQLAGSPLPCGCHWGYSHPLKERIAMLRQPLPSFTRLALGSAIALSLSGVLGVAAWASQPPTLRTADQGRGTAAAHDALKPPAYPVEAAKQGISGLVSLVIDVDEKGRATAVKVEKSTPKGVFDEAATQAALNWQFNPDIRNGKPVRSRVRVPIEFQAPKVQVPAANDGGMASIAPTYGRLSPPAFPAGAGLHGRVLLKVLVGSDGRAQRVELDRSSGYAALDESARHAVARWSFQPARQGNRPVSAWVGVPVDFLRKGAAPIDAVAPGSLPTLEPIEIRRQ